MNSSQSSNGRTIATLTSREREVFTLVTRGQSSREIADTLFLSEGTVKIHVSRLLGKLGLRNRIHAVILAYETGVRVPGDS